jgi:hypothetical protein
VRFGVIVGDTDRRRAGLLDLAEKPRESNLTYCKFNVIAAAGGRGAASIWTPKSISKPPWSPGYDFEMKCSFCLVVASGGGGFPKITAVAGDAPRIRPGKDPYIRRPTKNPRVFRNAVLAQFLLSDPYTNCMAPCQGK